MIERERESNMHTPLILFSVGQSYTYTYITKYKVGARGPYTTYTPILHRFEYHFG